MKKVIGVIALTICAFAARAQADGPSVDLRPGLAVVEHKVKSNVYEIKLKSVGNADQGQALDNILLSKQGILSAHTDWSKRLCRVEALSAITEQHLEALVRHAGLEIAKTNQD